MSAVLKEAAAGVFPNPAETDHRAKSGVIYQIYWRTFFDSNGDGVGDLQGIAEKLDYLKSLGVGTLWINPFYPTPPEPEGDGGYAISDFRGMDPAFGAIDQFKDFLQEAHNRGLRIMIDFVPCHTAHTHKWFQKSANPEDPEHEKYRDFYIWHPPSGYADDGRPLPPNNWMSVFDGPAWTYNEQWGEFYLRHFGHSQPALNYNSPDVREEVLKDMKFWLDMGVDDLRLDALPFLGCPESFEPNPYIHGCGPGGNGYEAWNVQYFQHSMCQPGVLDFIREVRSLLDSYPERKTALGEVIAGPEGGRNSIPLAAQYVGAGLHSAYTNIGFGIKEYPEAHRMKDILQGIMDHFPEGGHVLCFGNHDFPRFRTWAQKEEMWRQLMQFLATCPGDFVLYNGDELGLPDAPHHEIPEHVLKDRFGRRDLCRTPMPWWVDEKEKNAGFSQSEKPYYPVPESHHPLAVNLQDTAPSSMLNQTRRLLAWRQAQPALTEGGPAHLLNTWGHVVAFTRKTGEQTMLCAFNIGGNQVEGFCPAACGLDDETLHELRLTWHSTISLAPYGAFVIGDRPVENLTFNQMFEVEKKPQKADPVQSLELVCT